MLTDWGGRAMGPPMLWKIAVLVMGASVAILYAAPQPTPPKADLEWRLGWSWDIDRSDPKDEVLRIVYDDGRHYLFRDKSITAVKFFPSTFAERLGNGFAFIEIYCGANMTRLDVTDEDGRALVALLSKSVKDRKEQN